MLKIIGQLIVLGGRIIAGTIKESIKQASVKGAGRTKGAAATASISSSTPTSMSIDEAYKILNVQKNISSEELQQQFEAMFKANDRRTGGSFYLQSKIVRARERIEMERDPA